MRLQGSSGTLWLDDRDRGVLEGARLAAFEDVMATSRGRRLRVLHDRENWYLSPSDFPVPSCGMYLKKHRVRTCWTWLRAKLGLRPGAGAGRIEAENVRALAALGILAMRVVACGEKLYENGRFESFLLTEELAGYAELEGFLRRRFANPSPPTPLPERERGAFARLLRQVAAITRRLHAAGYNHRDLNCYHFLVKEPAPGAFDVRLIDLQRTQRRRWRRWRWIVKDLAQLAASAPVEQIGCREKIAFLRHYLGVRKLRPQDKRLVASILRKQRWIEWREERKA